MTEDIQDVVLELSPDQVLQDPLPRNLTLILKSEKPVKWIIKSKGIRGQLIIAAGNKNINFFRRITNNNVWLLYLIYRSWLNCLRHYTFTDICWASLILLHYFCDAYYFDINVLIDRQKQSWTRVQQSWSRSGHTKKWNSWLIWLSDKRGHSCLRTSFVLYSCSPG